MITIDPSPTADTRTCDFANVTKETLLASSRQHIRDVGAALNFFTQEIAKALHAHDVDKITDIDGFHRDFIHGFTEPDYTEWWRKHRQLNRHHLTYPDGTPTDVNLIDVLDFIADCVMAGMARSGSVYELKLSPELLERAFQNTVTLLKSNVQVRAAVRAGGVPQQSDLAIQGISERDTLIAQLWTIAGKFVSEECNQIRDPIHDFYRRVGSVSEAAKEQT